MTGFDEVKPSSRGMVIDLEQGTYFRKSDNPDRSGSRGGLIEWGDLDGDGCDDVIIALTRRRGSRTDKTWIEAWSMGCGKRIWQVTGVANRKDGQKKLVPGYELGTIAKAGDVDGDGVADVYCQQRGEKLVLLYSGKTGQLIEKRDSDRVATFVHPVRAQDVNGDGAVDLWFVKNEPALFVIHTALGGKHVGNVPLQWPGVPQDRHYINVAVSHFTDTNQDGFADLLLERTLPNPGGRTEMLEMAVLDGTSLQLLHKFETPAPRVFGETAYASPGDLTGDGWPDVVKGSACGEGDKGRVSFLQLIDGKSGKIVWKVTGNQAGGIEMYAVNVKTGERTDLPPDITYGGPVMVVPDMNGDGTVDLAMVCFIKGGAGGAVFVHSGRDGQLIGTVAPESDRVRLHQGYKEQVALLKNTKSGAPQIVSTGRDKQGNVVLTVLVLPRP